jgi:hypothetical protein
MWALSRELGAKPADVALAWLLRNPVVSTTVVEASTSEELRSDLGALSVQLDAEVGERLDEIWPGPGGSPAGVRLSTHGYASSRASEVERSRKAFACSCRSFAFCSAMAMASAPPMKRCGGGCWLAIVMRAFASLAGSPGCWRFMLPYHCTRCA